ncbi:TetR/AcrR family transcriptional regulator [Brevibacterium otitidis]|uniref:TetR/AcrR family transcriptional regulator n=1 Tax=Brevibacterium otitidis TaxID=53364 RepID=A0ABV5X0Z1_9MICO|nr:TetR/AcrR family transcriptional regulator [Brevibacterium otitidis]
MRYDDRSAQSPDSATRTHAPAGIGSEDLTARARIRQAAIRRFAAEGIDKARLKDIAADAGVTTPLITHHFGTKDGLRAACDEYLAAQIREQKERGLSQPGQDALQAIREHFTGSPLLSYLVQTLSTGGAHVDELVDRMVDDALEYMRLGVDSGVLRDTPKLPQYITVLTMWQLGAMVMHRHVKRRLDIDLLDDATDSAFEWAQLAGEILTEPVMLISATDLMGEDPPHTAGEKPADHTTDGTGASGADPRKDQT